MGPNARRGPRDNNRPEPGEHVTELVVTDSRLDRLTVRTKDRGVVRFVVTDDGTAGDREPRRSPRPSRPAGATMTK